MAKLIEFPDDCKKAREAWLEKYTFMTQAFHLMSHLRVSGEFDFRDEKEFARLAELIGVTTERLYDLFDYIKSENIFPVHEVDE